MFFFIQGPISSLAIAKPAFDHPEGVFNVEKITFAECKRLKILGVSLFKLKIIKQVGSLISFLCFEYAGYIIWKSFAIERGAR